MIFCFDLMENQKLIIEFIETFNENSYNEVEKIFENVTCIFDIIHLKSSIYSKFKAVNLLVNFLLKDEKILTAFSKDQDSLVNLTEGYSKIIALSNQYNVTPEISVHARSTYLGNFLKNASKYPRQDCAKLFSHIILTDSSLRPVIIKYLLTDSNIINEYIPLLKTNSTEILITYLLHESHEKTPLIFESIHSQSPGKLEIIIERLFFIRSRAPLKTFDFLIATIFKCSSVLGDELIVKTLFTRLCEIWSEKMSIEQSSVNDRLILSVSIASFINHFGKDYLKLAKNFTTFLSGISNHLSSNRKEVRNLGMELGQWIMNMMDLPIDSKEAELKFEVVENDLIQSLRKFTTMKSTLQPEDLDHKTDKKGTDQEISKKINFLELDSDDDDEDEIGGFKQPIQQGKESLIWERNSSGGPYYVRECLDGILVDSVEDNKLFTRCLGRMEQILLSHPIMAKEMSLEVSRTLLYLSLPHDNEEMETNRLKSLTAITCIDPPRVFSYILGELSNVRTAISIRNDIIYTITNATIQISQCKMRIKSNSLKSSIEAYKRKKEQGHANLFLEHCPLVFNGLLNILRASNTNNNDQHESFITARMISSIGVVYAASQASVNWFNMTEDLASLCQNYLDHSDPVIRRSTITTMGIIFSLNDNKSLESFLSSVKMSMMDLIRRETDEECKKLAILSIK